MAKVLNKTGIDTNEAIIANYVNNTTNALTGVDDYTINISGSSTITGSLNISGSINIIGDGLTVNVSATTISGSGIAATSQIASIGDFTIRGNTSLGNAITDTTTIKGNITGSGNMTITSFVSGSVIIGKKNVVNKNNSEGLNETMNLSTYPPDSVVSVNLKPANETAQFTLPNPVGNAGLKYNFLSFTPSTQNAATLTISREGLLNGIAICDDGTKDVGTNSLIVAATKFIAGTRIYCISDGTIWHITAFCLCDLADIS
tara:strand:- start:22 stop:801 length:780 start_codon:yes stop_codon:yes gene_type:complete